MSKMLQEPRKWFIDMFGPIAIIDADLCAIIRVSFFRLDFRI